MILLCLWDAPVLKFIIYYNFYFYFKQKLIFIPNCILFFKRTNKLCIFQASQTQMTIDILQLCALVKQLSPTRKVVIPSNPLPHSDSSYAVGQAFLSAFLFPLCPVFLSYSIWTAPFCSIVRIKEVFMDTSLLYQP